jgi:hypothetical protein
VKIPRAAFFVVLAALARAAGGDWAPNITTTATWNSNATNANRASDVIGALELRANLASAARFALGTDDALFAGVNLNAESWPRFDGLDHAALGSRLTWQHKFGLGALAPVFGLTLAGDAIGARESGRRARAGSAIFTLRKRLDEVTRVILAQEFSRHDAREFVFDRTGAETSLEFSRDLDERWTLALFASWRTGGVQSYATPPRPDLVALAKIRQTNTTFDRPMVVYSLDARSLTGGLAATRTLGGGGSLAFRYEWRQTERGPLRYVNHLVSAALARQF